MPLPSGRTEHSGQQEEIITANLDLGIILKKQYGRRLPGQTGIMWNVDITIR